MNNKKNDCVFPSAKYWDHPWNPIIGCRPVSPACDNCYARSIVQRFNMTGCDVVDFAPTRKESCGAPPKKGVVFCGNMTDLFGYWLDFDEIAGYIRMTMKSSAKGKGAKYLWLTKRPVVMTEVLFDEKYGFHGCDMSNQWFGFTAENQDLYDERIEEWNFPLPGHANGWLSAEPLLGPLDLRLERFAEGEIPFKWVVVGCESGPRRRPCRVEWVESVVSQCMSRGVSVFVKQLDVNGKCEHDIAKFHEHLRIRQIPWNE
ncbi:MAG: phage Gp37/Gp68 family protein [Bacteroidales bacterium]|nr:phage Gp37/Gp68 family protein [Bacteroidales bacterium]